MDAEKRGERMNREHDNETADSAVDPYVCVWSNTSISNRLL